MSAEKEAGLAALQAGKAAEAISYLETAVHSTPNDLQALLSLGNAYGQTGRHNDAVRIVLQAVTLQPSYAEARYSLAVAYENAGHREYALTAARQALQLQPTDTRAQALVARLSNVSGEPTQALPGAYPPAQTASRETIAPTTGQPTTSMPASSYPSSTPSPYGQNPSPYGQPGAGGYRAESTAAPYGAPTSNPVPPQTGGEPYRSQGAAAYGSAPPSTYYTPTSQPGVAQPPDKFDMKQAIKDWVRVLREPNSFFREQAERTGYNAPLAFLLAIGIGTGIFAILSGLIQLALNPSAATTIVIQMVFGATGGITGVIMRAFLWGGFLHVVGRMFGNRQSYHPSFRVSAYSMAPLLIFSALSTLLVPVVMPASAFPSRPLNSPSPFGQLTPVQFSAPSTSGDPSNYQTSNQRTTSSGGRVSGNPLEDPAFRKIMQGVLIISAVSIPGTIWCLCLQAIGLRYAQKLSPGAAAGTVLVSVAIPVLLVALLVGLFFALIMSLINAASQHSPGFIQALSMLSSSSAVWHVL